MWLRRASTSPKSASTSATLRPAVADAAARRSKSDTCEAVGGGTGGRGGASALEKFQRPPWRLSTCLKSLGPSDRTHTVIPATDLGARQANIKGIRPMVDNGPRCPLACLSSSPIALSSAAACQPTSPASREQRSSSAAARASSSARDWACSVVGWRRCVLASAVRARACAWARLGGRACVWCAQQHEPLAARQTAARAAVSRHNASICACHHAHSTANALPPSTPLNPRTSASTAATCCCSSPTRALSGGRAAVCCACADALGRSARSDAACSVATPASSCWSLQMGLGVAGRRGARLVEAFAVAVAGGSQPPRWPVAGIAGVSDQRPTAEQGPKQRRSPQAPPISGARPAAHARALGLASISFCSCSKNASNAAAVSKPRWHTGQHFSSRAIWGGFWIGRVWGLVA